MRAKKYFLSFVILLTITSWVNLALAQTSGTDYSTSGVGAQIEQFLCAPTKSTAQNPQNNTNATSTIEYKSGAQNEASSDLYNCINRLYSFAILIASVVGVFFIVIAGYLYISAGGNDESISKAKNILVTTITSLVILFSGYVLLKAINPDIIQFRSVQPPSVRLQPAIAPGEGGVDTSVPTQTVTGTTQQLAQQVLGLHNSGKIILATNHSSGNTDNANALQNIKDIAEAKPAQRSSYQHNTLKAPGGSTAIEPAVLQAIIALEAKFGKFTISEIAGGAHSNNSDHYTGRAFDVSQINGSGVNSSHPKYRDFMNECTRLGAKLVLGPGNTGHSTHIHCSWSSGGPAMNQPTTSNTTQPTHCQAKSTYNCSEPGTTEICSVYNSYLQEFGTKVNVSGTNGAALLKAIMYHESRCRKDAASGSSYGLMQMQVQTANNSNFKQKCGITGNIDIQWFKDNARLSICLAAEYLNEIAQSQCGSSLQNILAAYSNGISGACTQNSSCSNQACGGDTGRNWHCTNTTQQARNSVPEIMQCISKF